MIRCLQVLLRAGTGQKWRKPTVPMLLLPSAAINSAASIMMAIRRYLSQQTTTTAMTQVIPWHATRKQIGCMPANWWTRTLDDMMHSLQRTQGYIRMS